MFHHVGHVDPRSRDFAKALPGASRWCGRCSIKDVRSHRAERYRSHKLSPLTRRTFYKAFTGYQGRCRYAAAGKREAIFSRGEKDNVMRSRLSRMARRIDVFIVARPLSNPGKSASIVCCLTRNEFTPFCLLLTKIPRRLTVSADIPTATIR